VIKFLSNFYLFLHEDASADRLLEDLIYFSRNIYI